MSGVLRPLRALAALVVVAFALTGCMKIDITVAIDGGRDVLNGSLIFAMEKNILTMDGKSPEEGFKATEDELSTLPKGTRNEVYDDGRYYGRRVHFENMPFSEFNAADDGPRITHENGKYIFTYDTDPADLGDIAALGAQVLDSIQYTVSVTFPGEVVERDAKAMLEGRTVKWNLKVSDGHNLRAVSEEPTRFPWLLLGAVAGLFGLLVVAGIVALAIRMNRRPAPATGDNPYTGQTLDTAVS